MAVIKRPQHNSKLATVLNQMLQCSSLVDVTIYCDDGQVNAHKLVLAASSTYFRNLFSRMTNTFHYPIIVLREMPVNDLKTIIQFIYHGEVNVPQNRVDSLMRCANYLQIDGMASSANSLNAILASSSAMSASHQPIITGATHLGGPLAVAVTSNNPNNSNSTTTSSVGAFVNNSINLNPLGKIHPQYPPAMSASSVATGSNTSNTQKSRHGRRGNHNNNNNQAMNNIDHSSNNTNSGKPRHTCPMCLKTFTHGFTLKRHMELHSNNRKTIFCPVCSKSYSCKDSFLRHQKSSGHQQHAEFHHRSSDLNIR